MRNGVWGIQYEEWSMRNHLLSLKRGAASLTDAGQGEREVLGDVEGVDGPAKVQQPTLQCQQQPQVHVQPARASLLAARGGRGLAQSPVSTAMPAPARPAARLTFRAVPSSRLFFPCRCPPGSAPSPAPCCRLLTFSMDVYSLPGS